MSTLRQRKPSVDDENYRLGLFLKKVDKESSPDGCWLWTASKDQLGYGFFYMGTKRFIRAHRASYELFVGPIPDGKSIDHICRVRNCVNPAHLRPLSHKENVLCGIGPTAVNAAKTHCKFGHEFSGENVAFNKDGTRRCRECCRIRSRSEKYRAAWKKSFSSPERKAERAEYERARRAKKRAEARMNNERP